MCKRFAKSIKILEHLCNIEKHEKNLKKGYFYALEGYLSRFNMYLNFNLLL